MPYGSEAFTTDVCSIRYHDATAAAAAAMHEHAGTGTTRTAVDFRHYHKTAVAGNSVCLQQSLRCQWRLQRPPS